MTTGAATAGRSRPRPLPPATVTLSRTATPGHHRTRLPRPPARTSSPGHGRPTRAMHARLSCQRQAGTPCPRDPSVESRRCHRPRARPYARPPYVRGHRDTAARSATRRHMAGQRRNGPPTRINAASGPFRSVWRVLGSNQRRLSRRFYRPLSLCTSQSAADQQICAGGRDLRIPCSSALGFQELARATDRSTRGHGRPGQKRLS